ncbi:MAG TPA: hypothetical protein VGF50_06775 [Caulobacteraceae bacterium]|jgi:hypothetical protein
MQRVRVLAAAAMAGGLFAATSAMAQPDGTINFSGGHIAFIGAVQWGSGTLHFRGHRIPISVSGIGVGAIGANSFSASGEVYHLRRASDIVGTYTAVNASATAGAGAGLLDMTNGNGVEIKARSSTAGLSLSLAPTGMVIKLK